MVLENGSFIDDTAEVDAKTVICAGCYIGAGCKVGACKLGPYTFLNEKVVLEDGVETGRDVTVDSFTHVGKNTKLGHFAIVGPRVLIGDNVKIGNRVDLALYCADTGEPLRDIKDDAFFMTISSEVVLEPSVLIGYGYDKTLTTFIGEKVKVFAFSYIRPGAHIGAQSDLMPFCFLDQGCTLRGNNKLTATTIVGGEAVLEEHVCGLNRCVFKNKTTYKRFIEPQPSFYGFDCNTYIGLDAIPMSTIMKNRRKKKV